MTKTAIMIALGLTSCNAFSLDDRLTELEAKMHEHELKCTKDVIEVIKAKKEADKIAENFAIDRNTCRALVSQSKEIDSRIYEIEASLQEIYWHIERAHVQIDNIYNEIDYRYNQRS